MYENFFGKVSVHLNPISQLQPCQKMFFQDFRSFQKDMF